MWIFLHDDVFQVNNIALPFTISTVHQARTLLVAASLATTPKPTHPAFENQASILIFIVPITGASRFIRLEIGFKIDCL